MLVGIFVVTIFSGILFFILWFNKTNIHEEYHLYYIYFDDVVTNLEKGSAVHYRGIHIGEVTDIRLAPDNVELVRVTVKIQKNFPIKNDVVARLEMTGITGYAFIQLTGGTKKSRLLKAPPGEKFPVIPGKHSEFQAFLKNTPLLIENTSHLAQSLNHLLRPEVRETIFEIIKNTRDISAGLKDKENGLPEAIKDFQNMTTQITLFMQNMNKQSDEIEKLLANIDQSFHKLNDGSLDKFDFFLDTTTKHVDKTSIELYQLLQRLNKIALELEKNPLGFLVNGEQKGIRLK